MRIWEKEGWKEWIYIVVNLMDKRRKRRFLRDESDGEGWFNEEEIIEILIGIMKEDEGIVIERIKLRRKLNGKGIEFL